jgi:uncharacterized membrane protein YfcA
MPDLTLVQWLLAIAAAAGIGISKSGFAGIGLFHVIIFAFLFGARESTGVLLPMLIAGDVGAVLAFRRHARWDYLLRILPPTAIGVIAGASVMSRLDDARFRPVIGWIVIGLAMLQAARMLRPVWFADVPHSRSFAWAMGFAAGASSMLANAAGPVVTLYCLAVALPKWELVGTMAWFFLVINVFKLPFSIGLGLVHVDTLRLTLVLAPAIAGGLFLGGWLTRRVPQRLFDSVLLAFAAIAALRLIGAI